MRARPWWAALVALGVGACGEVVEPDTDGGARDGGLPNENPDGNIAEADKVKVSGRVSVGYTNAPAPRVKVVAYCDQRTVDTLTADDGTYALTVDIAGQCNRFALEFTKEAHLPVLKTIPLNPLPADDLTLDVALGELKELICGERVCITQNDRKIQLDPDPVARGFVGIFSGPLSLPFLAGEFRNTEGQVLFVPAFAYFDLRDQGGNVIGQLPPRPDGYCVGIDPEAKSQLSDVRKDTGRVEMPAHVFDPQTGRWRKITDDGYVGISDGSTPDGFDIIRAAREEELGDIRSGFITQQIWACGPLPGSGWLAFGVPIQRTGCLRVEVADRCGNPVPYAAFKVVGHDLAFQAETWTDGDGDACITTAPSEALNENLNHNRADGETFRYDVSVTSQGIPYSLPSTDMPSASGNCLDPGSCIPFAVTTDDFRGNECP
jgi:hypothetical protein